MSPSLRSVKLQQSSPGGKAEEWNTLALYLAELRGARSSGKSVPVPRRRISLVLLVQVGGLDFPSQLSQPITVLVFNRLSGLSLTVSSLDCSSFGTRSLNGSWTVM
ncbi:hypothetical protein BDV06DRAFT_223187 [Aspergillus oleicola]